MADRRFALLNQAVDDAQLSDNVPLLDANNTFTGELVVGSVFFPGVAKSAPPTADSNVHIYRTTTGHPTAGSNNEIGQLVLRPRSNAASRGILLYGTNSSGTESIVAALNPDEVELNATLLDFNGNVDISGALTAVSYGGITAANLLDKSAAETVAGAWSFTAANTPPAALASRLTQDMLYLDGKEAIDGNDTWLRLNQNLDFTSGIYTPGQIRPANGSATSPAFSFSGDSNTGMYTPSADIVALTTGGEWKAQFRPDDNLIRNGFKLLEQATAVTASLAYGQLWVRSDNPNTLVYTDDFGVDVAVFGDAGIDLNSNRINLNGALGLHVLIYTISATTHNYALEADVGVLRVAVGTGGETLTGMTGGFEGRMVYIHCFDTSDSLTISHQNGSSTDVNRFSLVNEVNLVIPPLGGACFIYLGSRWRTVSTAP